MYSRGVSESTLCPGSIAGKPTADDVWKTVKDRLDGLKKELDEDSFKLLKAYFWEWYYEE